MLGSLNSAVSGLKNFQEKMDTIGNNIANVNTTGYKAARNDFADSFNETLQSSSASTGTTTGTDSMQIGTGVTTSAIKNIFTQGSMASTGVKTDLAIEGEGYFVVHDLASDAQLATRAGNFEKDTQGYLVTATGQRVQGYSDAGLTTIGDIKIDDAGKPAASTGSFQNYTIDQFGKINVTLTDGTQFVRGQVLLQNFQNQQALLKQGNNLYSGLNAAGPLATAGAPGTNGLGHIVPEHLELSNVDLANEFASLITTQRGFQANARIISTSDELLQELVNLTR